MRDSNLLSPRCVGCASPEGPLCGGIGKNILTIEELAAVPARCFVDEVDLNDGEKKIITNPKRDGALVALIDSLLISEQKEIQESVEALDGRHYIYNENIWVATAIYFFGEKHKRQPTAEEFVELTKKNDPKYRALYILLFPHMIDINPEITPRRLEKLGNFLTKASEVVAENIRRYGFNGACGYFTVQMAEAKRKRDLFAPTYASTIIGRYLVERQQVTQPK